MMIKVEIIPLAKEDREQFVRDNQEAFNYGALEEFGVRDHHMEENGQIISRQTILQSIKEGEAYWILCDGVRAGGAVVKVSDNRGELELLFVSLGMHSKGIGQAAWREIENLYPAVKVWETVTPYFEKRNIHFYVNCLGFHIVEFFNSHHPEPGEPNNHEGSDDFDGMFRFEKRM